MSNRTHCRSHQLASHSPFERIALLLPGGGALGAYQAGVYEALAEVGVHPNWVAGISIGAINAAIVAGNPVDLRVRRLRDFWEFITMDPWRSSGGGAPFEGACHVVELGTMEAPSGGVIR